MAADLPYSSFDDSEQFDEDSTSWVSDPDQYINWSGWKRSSPLSIEAENSDKEIREVLSLIELCSKCVAQNHPFEVVELYHPPIPDALQLRIAYYSFPESEEDIRLYSCLASGSNDKFKNGETLVKSGNVQDVIQIGFHLSGVVTQPGIHTPAKQAYNVSITFDRGRITSCQCSCQESAAWCCHATAICLYRIINKKDVSLRAPVSESLSRLQRDQLQKFAQYLISELPQQILPTAQRLLDELLSSKSSTINVVDGAPDPTGGASITEDAKWILDENSIQENIKKILSRFCGLPISVMDTNTFYSVPPVSLEWSNLLRSFQGHEPEALWNLLSITRHLFSKGDQNGGHLLHLVTEECLLSYQMMFYWVLSQNNVIGNSGSRNRRDHTYYNFPSTHELSRHATAHLMEEVVHLWELTAMTPYLNSDKKLQMKLKFEIWNQQIIEAARKGQGQGIAFSSRMVREFMGFNTPIQATEVEWDRFYEILGILPRNGDDGTAVNRLTIRTNQNPFYIDFEKVYPQLVSLKPPSMDELTLINKLTQSLNCHGYLTHASQLACVLGQKILNTYPERVAAGELNFMEITEKARDLCARFLNCEQNERITFELAILGLTVPRLPASTNLEEMKLTFLETELYKRLKSMQITDERLTFIRYQARKLLSKTMLRGDIVLPYMIAMFIFEVMCGENIGSCAYAGQQIRYSETARLDGSDKQLGYKCALVTLGLYSNAVDHKQPMLCESIRQHRRDLALALLLHCRQHSEKIEEVLSVLLDKERYSSFMRTQQSPTSAQSPRVTKDNASRKKANNVNSVTSPPQQNVLSPKYGFIFAGVYNDFGDSTGSDRSDRNNAQHLARNEVRTQSDSDSGNGDASYKRSGANRGINIPNASSKKTSQQRRQSRQNAVKNRSDKPGSRGWTKTGTRKTSQTSKTKGTRELTDSDSGQEMNSPCDEWESVMENSFLGAHNQLHGQQNQQKTDNPPFYNAKIPIETAFSGSISRVSSGEPSTHSQPHDKQSEDESRRRSWPHANNTPLVSKSQPRFINSDSVNTSSNRIYEASSSSSIADQLNQYEVGTEKPGAPREPNIDIPFLIPHCPIARNTGENDDDDDFNISEDIFGDPIIDNLCDPEVNTGHSPDHTIITFASNNGNETADAISQDCDDRMTFPDNELSSPYDFSLISRHQPPIKTDEGEISDPLVSSSSNDSLNVVEMSENTTDVAMVTKEVIVNGVNEQDINFEEQTRRKDEEMADEKLKSPEVFSNEQLPNIIGTSSYKIPNENEKHGFRSTRSKVTSNYLKEQIRQSDSVTSDDLSSPDLRTRKLLADTSGSSVDSGNDSTGATTISRKEKQRNSQTEEKHKATKTNSGHIENQKEVVETHIETVEEGQRIGEEKPNNPCLVDEKQTVNEIDEEEEYTTTIHDSDAVSIKSPKDSNKTKIELSDLQQALSIIQQQQQDHEHLPQVKSQENQKEGKETSQHRKEPDATLNALASAFNQMPPTEVSKTNNQLPLIAGMVDVKTSSMTPETEKPDTKAANVVESVDTTTSGASNRTDSNSPPTSSRTKKSKKKQKKSSKSKKVAMNLQSVEAEAFSLFELAKSLLAQLRNNTVGVFSVDVEEISTTNNRQLQLAAFEIGLFALNIHNYSSPNWFSRTYSSYVSWIDNQAVEIGTAALRILNEKWEGVLTPSESISIACRASRPGDQFLKRIAAELALSCLPYSQSLNRNEITQTITLCRNQNDEMLERACSAVENASRNGGVQPELLFSIAREWHYLHEKLESVHSNPNHPNENHSVFRNWNMGPPVNQPYIPIYVTAEQYVQEMMHQQAQEMLGRTLPRSQQSTSESISWSNSLHHVPLPQQTMHSRRIPNLDTFNAPVSNYPDELNFAEIPRYLQNSYRVGMRALKALTNRMPDERPEARFIQVPQCSDDIRWMLTLAASLGPSYLKNFCKVVYKAVSSPFLLHDLALEAARHFASFNPANLASYYKSPSVVPIVQKALAAYSDMVHHRLFHLQPSGYADFVELLRRTRSAFSMAPGGMARFNEILDFVRKTNPKKGELWRMIMNGLSTA